MAFVTVEELAAALRVRVTAENTVSLQACADAAATEIEHHVVFDGTETLLPSQLALLNRVNLVRAVEWWKSNDAAFGVVGFDQAGTLLAPRDSFNRHAWTLTPLKQAWGLA